MAATNSYILYEGPSLLDGSPIVAIATGFARGSANRKTGAMIQTWIMRSDVEPHHATKTGEDSTVCGGCPHRPSAGGACYVAVFQAPLAVYRAYKRGKYPRATQATSRAALGAGRKLRLGSYGDPAAVPAAVWEAFTRDAATWTGYTHQWRLPAASALRTLCMASVDSDAERTEAQGAGWRTFRVRTAEEPLAKGEIACPASDEAGKRTTCAECNLCKGSASKSRRSIAIIAHGAKARRFVAAPVMPDAAD